MNDLYPNVYLKFAPTLAVSKIKIKLFNLYLKHIKVTNNLEMMCIFMIDI